MRILGLEKVGNYGLRYESTAHRLGVRESKKKGTDQVFRLYFDDLHDDGIYSWSYLHHLCISKFSRMKKYILALRQQGQSRLPRSRKRLQTANKQK